MTATPLDCATDIAAHRPSRRRSGAEQSASVSRLCLAILFYDFSGRFLKNEAWRHIDPLRFPPALALKSISCPSVSNRLVIALAQIPAIVGDIAGNRDRLRKARKEAAAFGADIVMAPELYLSGYPPEDLVLKPAFPGSLPGGLRGARARRPPTAARRRWSACPGSRTASFTTPWRSSIAGGSRRCGSRSTCPITASSTRSASSPPDRRRGRSSFAACGSACRSARTSGGPTRSSASSKRAAKFCSCPTPRLTSATSSPSARTSLSRASSRAGCRSSISTWSAARTSSRSTAARSRSTPTEP